MMESVGSASVLVIDDLRDHAELWSGICANAGLRTMTAATGADGYHRARETRPEIILLDLMLPDLDGWEVCRRLRTDERTKDIPIVIVTARDEAHAERRAQAEGCAAYVIKPCRPPELVRVLKGILRARQARVPPVRSSALPGGVGED